ncbi:hypothetical protein HRG_003308 [Hirsutella rhossiliensis]|uniref:RING-type domain-containing protein n=1 Tax=Hirsutella rhossiliensis TaxID=111463 RepID=A0A9P8N609_9HYPO|nr:uncharacterized protein HRG_03308 [Hirsutella rhossiliensis]KAH0965292.1 hypothetical protein HRG_03308 [Hirsutella rhossiliensis]
MRSVPNIDLSRVPPPRHLLKRFSAELRRQRIERKARKLQKKTQAQPAEPLVNPLGQHPDPLAQHPIDTKQDSAVKSANSEVGDPVATTPAPPEPPTSPSQTAPGDRRRSSAAKSADTQVGGPVASTPARSGPSSLLGQTTPGYRRRSSAWRSADTQVGDPDAITPAPPVGKRKFNSSFSAGSTLLGSDRKPDKYPCHICGYVLGKPRGHGNKIERLAFLPCGQAFGHECLFHWLTDTGVPKYCPDCCVPMRHACEHLTAPTKFPPVVAFTDVKAAVMPWNYEFCESRKGLKLHATIKKTADRLRKAETRKMHREKSAMDFAHEAIRRFHGHTVVRAEKKLDEQHKTWWAVKWANFGLPE